MKSPETMFLECPICNFLNEVDSSVVTNKIDAKDAYGGEIVRTIEETHELVLCQECATALWPKEYSPKEPKIFEKKPKKPRKKRLPTKKKKRIIPTSKDKNEDIQKN